MTKEDDMRPSAGSPAAREPICCPKCNQPFGVNLVAKAAAESRMRFAMTPTPGEYMSLRAVGGALSALDGLLKASGRELGVQSVVLLERVVTAEDGQMDFHLVIARGKKKPSRAKPKAEPAEGGSPNPTPDQSP